MITKEGQTLPGTETFKVQEGSHLSQVLERLDRLQKDEKILVAQAGKPILKINPESNWAEWVEFFVAPDRCIFDAKRLENFRQGLFPDLKPGLDDQIRQVNDSLHLGYVAFDDKLLHRRRKIEDTVDVEYEIGSAERLGIDTEGSVIKRREDTLSRRTFVKVYPHISLAEVVARMKNEGPHYLSLYFSRLENELSKPQREKLLELIKQGRDNSSALYRAMQSVARQEEAEAYSQYSR